MTSGVHAPRATPVPSASTKHTLLEDALGLVIGTLLASFGLALLHSSTTVTGGTAGLSLLLSYAVPVPFSVLFALVNLPFLAAAMRRKGLDFTVRTLLAIALVMAFTPLHTAMLAPVQLPAMYAAVLGNTVAGVGLLILFRHRASLGGFTIIGLLVQERRGIRAGYVLLVLDLLVLLASLTVLPVQSVAISAVGALVMNLSIALNHRPDRYTGW